MIQEAFLQKLAKQVCNSTDPQPTIALCGCTPKERMYLCGYLAGKGIKTNWEQVGDVTTFRFERRW